jgi:hypothetical protein
MIGLANKEANFQSPGIENAIKWDKIKDHVGPS